MRALVAKEIEVVLLAVDVLVLAEHAVERRRRDLLLGVPAGAARRALGCKLRIGYEVRTESLEHRIKGLDNAALPNTTLKAQSQQNRELTSSLLGSGDGLFRFRHHQHRCALRARHKRAGFRASTAANTTNDQSNGHHSQLKDARFVRARVRVHTRAG